MRFFVLLVVAFLTVGALAYVIDGLRNNDSRFIRNEQVQRMQLCLTREQIATSQQRTPEEKRRLIAKIDEGLRDLRVPLCE